MKRAAFLFDVLAVASVLAALAVLAANLAALPSVLEVVRSTLP